MRGSEHRTPDAAFGPRHALGALAAMLSEYESQQLQAGLAGLEPTRAEVDGARCIGLAQTLRLERPALNHIFAMPGGLLFHQAEQGGQLPVATLIDPATGAVRTWSFPRRFFSCFVDPGRNWIWTVEAFPARLCAFDPDGNQRAELSLPEKHDGERLVPRHGVCAGGDILLGFYCGHHGVMRLAPDAPARSPEILLERLPHTERLYWADGLLLSQHITPNAILIHRIHERSGALLRMIPLRGLPLTLARFDQGCLACTAVELLRLDADYRPRWSADIATLGGWKLTLPSVTEAGGHHAWLKGRGSDTLYKISATY